MTTQASGIDDLFLDLVVPIRQPFLTGSRAYGFPREDSDWDFVVYEEIPAGSSPSDVPHAHLPGFCLNLHNPIHYSLKQGCLNVMVFCDPKQFDLARQITDELIAKRPVKREEAIAAFKRVGLTDAGT